MTLITIAGCCQPLTITVSVARAYVRFIDWLIKNLICSLIGTSLSQCTLKLVYLGHSVIWWTQADFYSADIVLSAVLLALLPGGRQNQLKGSVPFQPDVFIRFIYDEQSQSYLVMYRLACNFTPFSLHSPRSKRCWNRSLEEVHFWHIDSSICLISALIFTCKHGSSTIKYCSFFILSLCFVFFSLQQIAVFIYHTLWKSDMLFMFSLLSFLAR